VLGALPEAAEKGLALTVGRRIDEDHGEALVGEELRRANEKVPGAPARRAVGLDLQAAVAAGEQRHRRPRLRPYQ